jgi:peptide/nickel transport system permease protein
MSRWLLLRLSWLVVSLLGITAVTFVVLDRAPVDRAEIEAARRAHDVATPAATRDAAVLRLRVRYGLLDPETFEPAPLWRRYATWLANAATGRFAGPNEDHDAFWRRFANAAPVTMWLGSLALLVAFGIGVPLGAWTGMRAGSRADRAVSRLMLVAIGVPEFLFATLLLLAFAGAWVSWFPSHGLRTEGASQWSYARQFADFVWHLALPVTVMAIGPLVLVTRFLRDSVARTADMPFVANFRALGVEPAVVRRRVLHNAFAPAATLAGSLLPMLVGGSIVVENLFSLDGLGHLAFEAVLRQDQAMVMALVVITSVVTLGSLIVSDLLHRLVDPRVRLST